MFTVFNPVEDIYYVEWGKKTKSQMEFKHIHTYTQTNEIRT